MVAIGSATHTGSAGTGRSPFGGRAPVLRTEPRSTGSRPWRASIPIAESARGCRIRPAGPLDRAALFLAKPFAASPDASPRASGRQAGARAFSDQRPLELRQRAEDVEDELPGAGVSIDRFLQAAQPDALRAQGLGVGDEVLQRTAQPVEAPHHQRVAGTELGQRLAQGGALGRAAGRVLEDALAPCVPQRLPLQVEPLVRWRRARSRSALA